MTKLPEQKLPVIDPNQPISDNRFNYYILEKPESPSVTPPNAMGVFQYQRQQYLHDAPMDFRRPWGFVQYDHELSFEELDNYHLLHFDPDLRALFDLWKIFKKDNKMLLNFFKQFFSIIEDDPKQERIKLASKMVTMKWTLAQVTKVIKGLNE